MGLYDVVMGDGKQLARGQILLDMLGQPPVARFRDAWVEKGDDGQPVIAIYTRQGGGNRECYCGDYERSHEASSRSCSARSNEVLAAHALYIRDADDDFDCTYSTFWFRLPDDLPADVREALTEGASEPVNMSERWQGAIDRLKSGDLRPAETAMADQLGAFLSDPDPGDGPRIMEV